MFSGIFVKAIGNLNVPICVVTNPKSWKIMDDVKRVIPRDDSELCGIIDIERPGNAIMDPWHKQHHHECSNAQQQKEASRPKNRQRTETGNKGRVTTA